MRVLYYTQEESRQCEPSLCDNRIYAINERVTNNNVTVY